jgi:hypothetical protein
MSKLKPKKKTNILLRSFSLFSIFQAFGDPVSDSDPARRTLTVYTVKGAGFGPLARRLKPTQSDRRKQAQKLRTAAQRSALTILGWSPQMQCCSRDARS